MTTCVISQPRLFPGLHYLHRMMLADVFVVLDTVPFNPRHEEHRARIRSERGSRWVTVPMHRRGRDQLIVDTEIARGQQWEASMVGKLAAAYRKAPRFDRHWEEVRGVVEAGHRDLLGVTTASWLPAIDELGITCRLVHASELDVSSRGSTQLLDLCRAVGADRYVSGGFGRDYLNRSAFEAAGIEVRFHAFEPTPYPQVHEGFVPYLSYVDAMFMIGLDAELIRSQGSTVEA